MILQLKMNERLQHNMTPNKKLLDVNVSLKKKCLKKKIQQTSNFNQSKH
jgi:hypothetical protein